MNACINSLGIFYKCTKWLRWKSLSEIGVFSTLEVCTGRMLWMVWMHKHDCEQALQGSSIESRILVDPPSADISTERASNRSARANTNTIKNLYSNTYFHKKHLSLGYLYYCPEPIYQLRDHSIRVQNKYKYKFKLKYVFVYQNIARIANAVQVTLWLSFTNPQCHD